ncbi:MAG TPA: LuxR C-terminal-related transcriptional regulator [Mycobacterium sp.]|nr:LuxR C-terminal-related transcriptional regulator [Mycobacterium sp.]
MKRGLAMIATRIDHLSPIRGRDEQLKLIIDLLERVRGGVGGVAIIEGAAGLGKTRLLIAAQSMAQARSFRTGLGAAEPGHSAVEMATLIEALFGGDEPLIERTALRSRAASPEGRFWRLQDVESLMERAALRQPLLVCLDDVQWADVGCGFALRMLTQWLASLPIAWLIATRPNQGAPPIRRALAELTSAGAATIQLTSLDASAVAQLAADVLGARAGGDLLRTLADVRGNPFLIVDLLAGLREERLVCVVDGRAKMVENRVPHRLEDSMRRRLSRITPMAERAAIVAASLARQFTLNQIAAMGAVAIAELVAPVQEVINAGMFIEVGGRLAFQHDLARDAVRGAVPAAVRRALDREAADVLLAGGALPVEVATQLAQSAEPGDLTAIRTLADAADALAMTDPSASADIANAALALTPARHVMRGPLVARRTVSLFAANRSDEARAFADHTLRQSLPAEQEAELRLSVAGMFAISADDRAANARHALSLAGLPADLRARLWASLFHNLLVAGRLDEAAVIEADVHTSVSASTDLAAQYFFQIGRSAMEYQLGRFERALRLLGSVDRKQLAGIDDPRERLTHSYRSWLLSALDRVEEAGAVADDGLASAQRDRQNWAVHVFETWKGRHLLRLGRLEEANAALEGHFRPTDAHLIVGVLDAAAVVALGRVKIHLGEDRAATDVAEIAQVMLATSAPVVRRHAAWYLAVHAMAAGDPHRAHRWLCALGKQERLSLFPLFPMEVADDPLLVRMALAVGDEELASAVTVLARRRHELNPTVRSIAAIAAHTQGLLHESTQDLQEAAALLTSCPRPLALAAALEDLGCAKLADGDRTEAVAAFDRVLPICVDAGALADAARMRHRLRELGIRRRVKSLDRPKRGWDSLTDAELHVVRLAAEGYTNRAIATTLFISPHTVNTHLRHVFDKLGIRSRVDLTRIAVTVSTSGN